MAAAKIGDARCPLCGGTARVSLSKSNYAVMTMNCCNAQLFTRSPRSDELVRDLIKPAAPGAVTPEVRPAPVRTEKPATTPAPAPAEPVRTEPKVMKPAAGSGDGKQSKPPAPAPAPSGGIGLLGSWFAPST